MLVFGVGYVVRGLSVFDDKTECLSDSNREVFLNEVSRTSVDKVKPLVSKTENSVERALANQAEIEELLDRQLKPDADREKWRKMLEHSKESERRLLEAYPEEFDEDDSSQKVDE